MKVDDRDPGIQRLFNMADEALAGEAFVADVLSRAERHRRRVIATRIGVGLACALVALPFQDIMFELAQIPLISIEDGWRAQLLAPFNNVGAPLSLAVIGLRILYRKVFSS